MATPTDYGTDVRALDDLPDPDALVSGDLNVAYALGRRLLQPTGVLLEIGDEEPYDSLDLREYLGKRLSPQEVRDLEAACERVLAQEERVETVSASVTFVAGAIAVSVSGEGSEGPFDLVLTVDNVTAAKLVVNR